MNNGPLLFLHPRSDDKRVVVNALDDFHGFQIGATLPVSSVDFLRDVGKPFFVDPMTYMFALPPEAVKDRKSGEIRKSLSSLARRYGKLIDDVLGKRMLTSEDLLQQLDALEEITANVLEYQRTKLGGGNGNLFNPYFAKYNAFAAQGKHVEYSATATTPWVIIPPYFYFTSVDDPWYMATLRCARLAARVKRSGEKIFASLFMSPTVLDDPEGIKRIQSDMQDAIYDGYFLWVNGMDEESASPERLAALKGLTAKLALKKPVFKLYGGFFSIMLHTSGLAGFSCSLNYRSSRDVHVYKWVAPGQPKPKFYIPRLHRAYDFEQAVKAMTAFPFLRCDCGLCKDAYGQNLALFSQRMAQTGFCDHHFLNVRRKEMDLAKSGQSSIVDELDDTIRQISKKQPARIRHLSRWRDTFVEQPATSRTALLAMRHRRSLAPPAGVPRLEF